MTTVGKILVILIMLFSVFFMSASVVVFTTATNWKEKSNAQGEQIKKLQSSLADAKAKQADAEGKLKAANDENTRLLAERQGRINDLTTQIDQATKAATDAQKQLETFQQNARLALDEATARKAEIDVLNATLAQAQDQANKFNAQNLGLQDDIRVLQREKATAEQNARDLRDFNGRTIAFLRSKGISVDQINKLDPNSVPPPVEGKVVDLSVNKRSMEISIGSDDGLLVGQELYVFRVQPRAEYIGKVKIVSVYPDKAVAEVIGNPVNGKKVQEGDIVSSTFFHSR